MKAGVVHLVLVVLAWPCAAQDHQCSAHTVVGAAEQKAVANLTRIGGLLFTKIYLHPESAFEGVLLSTTTSSGTNVLLWFPANTHCFTHNTYWWRVWVYCRYSVYSEDDDCYMDVGECQWSCRDIEIPGKPISGQVVAVGASRWRATEPTGNCTVAYHDYNTHYRQESCSLANKRPTTDSPSTTTTTTTDIPSTNTTTTSPTDNPFTTTTTNSPSTTTTTTDIPSTNTTTTSPTDNPFTTTTTDSPSTTTTTTDSPSTTTTTTTTDSPSTTTTTDFSTTTTTTNLLPMVLVVVVVVVVVVVMVVMVMKIRHNRPGAQGLSSSLALLYKKNVDNVAEYC